MQPKHWPAHLHYTTTYIYHSSVSSRAKTIIQGDPSTSKGSTLRNVLPPPVFIKRIQDEHHPAHGQYGLFASKKIQPRTLIMHYIGEVHLDERTQSNYDLSLYRSQDGMSIGIDATYSGNEARFINDYRGIRERPNAMFEEMMDEGELRIGITSGSETIRKGEEIVVSYGKQWWRSRSCEEY